MEEHCTITLSEAARRLAARDISAVELTRAMLARIERIDADLGAYASVYPELALAAAEHADARRQAGEDPGPLLGIPLGIKDIIAAQGTSTRVGSAALRDWGNERDSTVARRLREAGAVIIGKHQTTEGASGAHHPGIKPPVNPFNPNAWTGVSSSGSGVATAAGLAFGTFGSDTGGSIRFPSYCCGLLGLKPTWGRISRHGVFPLAETFDHVGPLARCIEDLALLYEAVAGRDPLDATTLAAPIDHWNAAGVRGMRVGIDAAYSFEGVNDIITQALQAAAEHLQRAGAKLVPVTVPRSDKLTDAWLARCAQQALDAHASTYNAQRDEYGPALSALLDYASGLKPEALGQAREEQQRCIAAYETLFNDIDVLLSPTSFDLTPTLATAHKQMRGSGMRRLVSFTAAANVTGYPTLSLPAGLDQLGVPFGYQILGARLSEPRLLDAGHAIEQATGWPRSPWLDITS